MDLRNDRRPAGRTAIFGASSHSDFRSVLLLYGSEERVYERYLFSAFYHDVVLYVVTGMLPAKTTHGLSANLHDGRHACRRQRIGCGDGRSLSVQTGRVCGFYLFCAADARHCCTLKTWLMCLEPVFPFAGIGYEGYVHTICTRHLFFDDLLYSLFFV